jgi:hypothetical protein
MLQIGDPIGDLIQAFGFHLALFRRSGIDCCDYTRRRTGSGVRNLCQFPMATGIPYD